MKRMLAVVLLASVAFASAPLQNAAAAAEATDPTDSWYPRSQSGVVEVAFYFVFSETCGHCAKAKPFIDELEGKYDWLRVTRVSTQAATDDEVATVMALADEIEEEIVGVPTYLYCERMDVGFDSAETTGTDLERKLLSCYDALAGTAADLANQGSGEPAQEPADLGGDEPDDGEDLRVPVLGAIDAEAVSLPLFTIAVAGLDAFNPCAFFVLLFLLSLLVHARSRWRMALVGGVFVVISGVMYFAFMAAWLNVFLVTGQLRWVTTLAGTVALAIAILNMKDYFLPDSTGSLSIPDSAKPGMFARMRKLTTGDAMPTVLLGTIALAAVANSYELLCTAGFPLVFTRVLTLNNLSNSTYYGYLALYNVVYVIPLLIIVGVFVWTLGSRKLSETEGQFLKLMSGMMMLGLGLLLVLKPGLLENMLAAVGILAGAALSAIMVSFVTKRRQRLAG